MRDRNSKTFAGGSIYYCAIAATPSKVCTTVANILRDRSGVSAVSAKKSRVGPYNGLDPIALYIGCTT